MEFKEGDILKKDMKSRKSWTVVENEGKLRLQPNTNSQFSDTEIVDFDGEYTKLQHFTGTNWLNRDLPPDADPYKQHVMGDYPLLDMKYFTPSIEDIRVGYEADFYEFGQLVHKTLKTEDNIDGIIYAMTIAPSAIIRVPYLTKEQIEAEGWHNFFNGPYSFSFSKGEYMVIYRNMMVGENRVISISIEKSIEGREFPITLFQGKCRDINEFRTICKLLEI